MAHDRKPLICPMCNFACYNVIELEQHFQIHSNENSINNIIISQVKSDVSETFYACQICDFMSAGEKQLEDHYKNKHPLNNSSQDNVTKPTTSPQSLSTDSKIDSSFVELSDMPHVSQTQPVMSSPLYACTFCGLLGSSLESLQLHYQNQHLDLFQTFLLQQGINRPIMTQPILSMEHASRMMDTQPSRFPTVRPVIPNETRNVKIPGSQTLTKITSSSSPSSETTLAQVYKTGHSVNTSIRDNSSNFHSSHGPACGKIQQFEQLDKSFSQGNNTPEPVPSFEIPVPKLISIYFCGLCNTKMNNLEFAYDHMTKYHGNSQTTNEMLSQDINLNKFDFKTVLEKNNLETLDAGNHNKTENQNKIDKTVPIENNKNELNIQHEDIQIAKESTPNLEATDKDSLQVTANIELDCTKKKNLNNPEILKSSRQKIKFNLDILFFCDVCGYVDKRIKFIKVHLRDNHELGSWSAMEVKLLNSDEVIAAEKYFRLKGHYKKPRESGCRELGFLCQSCSFYTNSHTRISMHNTYIHKKEGSYLYVEIRILLFNESQHLRNNKKISGLNPQSPSNEESEPKCLDSSTLKCQECNEDFHSLVELKRHIIATNHILRCRFCSFFTKMPNALTHHNYRKHSISLPEYLVEKAHKCPHCPYISPLYYKIINHIRLQHKDGCKYQCDSCYKIFATSVQFDNHCQVHKQLSLLPFPCQHCSYGALNESALERHINFKHSLEKSYRCPFCDYRSIDQYTVIQHLKNHHANSVQGVVTNNGLVIKDTTAINQNSFDISNISVPSSVNDDAEIPMETLTEEPIVEGFGSEKTDELNGVLDSDDFFSSDDMTEDDENESEMKT